MLRLPCHAMPCLRGAEAALVAGAARAHGRSVPDVPPGGRSRQHDGAGTVCGCVGATAPDQEPWLKQLLNITPLLASLSRWGVLISGLFTPPIERGAWSSAMMNRMLVSWPWQRSVPGKEGRMKLSSCGSGL